MEWKQNERAISTPLTHLLPTVWKLSNRVHWLANLAGCFRLLDVWSVSMRLGNEHVDRRHDEQSECRSDDHAAHQHDADAVAGSGSRPFREDEGKVADDRRRRCHQDGSQSRGGSFYDGGQLLLTHFLELIRKLDNQNAVLRHQSDEGDQSDLTVDVQRCEPYEREQQRSGNRQRDRSRQNDERIAEALELSGQHEIDQDS